MNTATAAAPSVEARSLLRLPRALIFTAAGLSFLFSVYLWFLVEREQGLFVGLWVPSILSLGGMIAPASNRAVKS